LNGLGIKGFEIGDAQLQSLDTALHLFNGELGGLPLRRGGGTSGHVAVS
jgi:hypothetical protein